MNLHDLILTFIAFLSELIGTISGFGSSVFFVPAASFIESFHLVLALTAILHCFGNAFRIFLFRKSMLWTAFFRLAIPSIILTGVGALLCAYIDTSIFEKSLGLVLVLISVFLLYGKKLTQKMSASTSIFISGFSGFLTGFVGTGGALRGIALAAMQIEKNSFVALSSSIDFGGDLLRVLIYLKNQYFDLSHWFYLPLLGGAAFLGSKIGKFILNQLSQVQFEKIVAAFILLSGLALLMKN